MNEIITKEAIQELQKSLTPVVEKLGKGGEWVYGVYYKQQIVWAVQNFISVAASYIALFFLIKFIKKLLKNDKYGENMPLIIICSICSVLFVFVAWLCISEGVSHLINPDYYILQDLLSIIKKS